MNKAVCFVLFLFFAVVFLVVGVCSVGASSLVEDSWSSTAPLHKARANFGVAALDGKIYAIGGTTSFYDLHLDLWLQMKYTIP